MADFVPGYEASGFAGIGVPRGTPAEIIDLLNKELNAGLADAKIKTRIVELGGTVLGRLARGIRDDHRGGHRKVGEGDQVRGHQGRIGRSPLDLLGQSQTIPRRTIHSVKKKVAACGRRLCPGEHSRCFDGRPA